MIRIVSPRRWLSNAGAAQGAPLGARGARTAGRLGWAAWGAWGARGGSQGAGRWGRVGRAGRREQAYVHVTCVLYMHHTRALHDGAVAP